MSKAWEDRVEKVEQEKQKMWEDMRSVIDYAKNNKLTTEDLIEQLTAVMG